jgi:hypothetical protein
VDIRRSLPDQFASLLADLSRLFRNEIALATAEIGQQFAQLARGSALLVAGGLIAHAGVLALVAAAVYGLRLAMPDWAAAAVVGGVVFGVGVVLALVGRARIRRVDAVPHRTVEAVREDAAEARRHLEEIGNGRQAA